MKTNTLIQLNHVKLNIVQVIPHCGEDVNYCIAEAIYLSSELGCTVLLKHNDRSFKINGDKITNEIYEKKLKEKVGI